MAYRPRNAELVGLKDAISHVQNDGWSFKYVPIEGAKIYTYGLFITDPDGVDFDVVMETRVEIKTFNKVQSLVNFHFENTPNATDVTIPKLPDQLDVKRG